jgi:Coenzyme PQQ synthesis protein D (PqqD)
VALSLRTGVLMTETEYGMALLDQGSGEYWTLNPTAAVVLRELLDGRTTEQAVAALTGAYDVSAELAEEDVARILDELRSARLLAR